ncbi:MAG: S8 family serine peptidase [Xanthomonadales bacterium]|nr:S8 family serine peptidase [Xanthomonadales bacterium]
MHARICLLSLCCLAAGSLAAADRPGTGVDSVDSGTLPPVSVPTGRPQWETRSDLDAAQRSAARRLPDALQELAAAALDGDALAADPARFRLVDGSTYGELFQVQRDKVVVDLTVVSDVGRAMNALAGLAGVEILVAADAPAFHVVSALVPPERLIDLAMLPGIAAVHAAGGMTGKVTLPPGVLPVAKAQGVVGNQAEQALEVEAVRRVFPVADGGGLRIGTLSDSANRIGGGVATSQGSGDLPAGGRVSVVADMVGGSPTDEGRAMMELIHDIAPGTTQLAFATATGGQANFAANIATLGATMDIINDDYVYFAEPYYQDGVVAQAVNTFVSNGGLYFALNHNYANLSYEGVFVDGEPNNWHNFSGGDEVQQITMPSGTAANPVSVSVVLQWSQPVGGATTDLSLEVWNAAVSGLVTNSTVNNIGGDPIESVTITNNTGAPLVLNMAVKRIGGAAAAGLTFKYQFFANGAWQVTMDEYNGGGGTLTPHAGTPNSIAIGAAPFSNRDVAEMYSGRGPFRRFFDTLGNPVGPFTYEKPDFLSIDRVNNSFFGSDTGDDADAFPNFSGTSAATPNAAAVGSLMLEMAGGAGSLTRYDMHRAMRMSAIELGAAGHDTTFGWGRIHALGATVLAMGPGSEEYTLYPDQHGDVDFPQNLFGITDVDRIEFSLKTSGNTTVRVVESHGTMDPMAAVFLQVLDDPLALAYDGGVGDDAQLVFAALGGIPNTAAVLSEADFSGGAADYTLQIDGPEQALNNRTGFMNGNGDDLNYPGNLGLIGSIEYVSYTAPFAGLMYATLSNPQFAGLLRLHDASGAVLNSVSVPATGSRNTYATGIVAGQQYVVMVAPTGYADNGDFNLTVNFQPDALFKNSFE